MFQFDIFTKFSFRRNKLDKRERAGFIDAYDIFKQDRQYTYNVILRRVRAIIVAMEK